jgi:hypothetical protein
MHDPRFLAAIETRIIERSKEEWMGFHATPKKSFFAPPVRDGGATEALIHHTARIACEEFDTFQYRGRQSNGQ